MQTPARLLGLDAGATTSTLAARCGEVALTTTGSALPRGPVAARAEAVAALVLDTLAALPLAPETALGVAADLDRPEEAALLAAALRVALPGVTVSVTARAELALDAAFPAPESGLALFLDADVTLGVRTEDGGTLYGGGWGAHVETPGGAAALGRAALAAIADDFDGGEPTVLRHRLDRRYGCATREAFRTLLHNPRLAPADLAPLVVDAADVPDWTATRILQVQANALAQRAAWLVGLAEQHAPVARHAVLSGPLTTLGPYREVLAEALLRHLPHWCLVRPARPLAEAALAHAAHLVAPTPAL